MVAWLIRIVVCNKFNGWGGRHELSKAGCYSINLLQFNSANLLAYARRRRRLVLGLIPLRNLDPQLFVGWAGN